MRTTRGTAADRRTAGRAAGRPTWGFLVLAGVFNVVVWPRFALAIVRDDRAWADGASQAWSSAPTSFFWVHAVLITAAVLIGLGVLAVGLRGLVPRR